MRDRRHNRCEYVPTFEAGSVKKGAQSVDRVAGRRFFLLGRPFREQRTILCAVPGPGMDPPDFSAGNAGKPKFIPLLMNNSADVQTSARIVLKILSARPDRLLSPQSQCEYPQQRPQQLPSDPPHPDIV